MFLGDTVFIPREMTFLSLFYLYLPWIQSMEFSRPEYWSGFPCPPQEDLPNPGIEPASFTSPASLSLVLLGKPELEFLGPDVWLPG